MALIFAMVVWYYMVHFEQAESSKQTTDINMVACKFFCVQISPLSLFLSFFIPHTPVKSCVLGMKSAVNKDLCSFSVCKRCIRKMDHHCPWVNNCVGENNQKYFVLFTVSILQVMLEVVQ